MREEFGGGEIPSPVFLGYMFHFSMMTGKISSDVAETSATVFLFTIALRSYKLPSSVTDHMSMPLQNYCKMSHLERVC